MAERKSDTGVIVIEEGLESTPVTTSRRSWRRGKVRTPPTDQKAIEARTVAKRRKANKRAKQARKRNR